MTQDLIHKDNKQPSSLTFWLFLALGIVVLTVAMYRKFSPPPEHGASVAPMGAPALISCLELQRILNSRNPEYNLAEDGVCGPKTMAAWDAEINNQYALESWPGRLQVLSPQSIGGSALSYCDPNRIEAKYVIKWESKLTGKTGGGTVKFARVEAHAWTAALNSKFPDITHWVSPILSTDTGPGAYRAPPYYRSATTSPPDTPAPILEDAE